MWCHALPRMPSNLGFSHHVEDWHTSGANACGWSGANVCDSVWCMWDSPRGWNQRDCVSVFLTSLQVSMQSYWTHLQRHDHIFCMCCSSSVLSTNHHSLGHCFGQPRCVSCNNCTEKNPIAPQGSLSASTGGVPTTVLPTVSSPIMRHPGWTAKIRWTRLTQMYSL